MIWEIGVLLSKKTGAIRLAKENLLPPLFMLGMQPHIPFDLPVQNDWKGPISLQIESWPERAGTKRDSDERVRANWLVKMILFGGYTNKSAVSLGELTSKVHRIKALRKSYENESDSLPHRDQRTAN